jgi:hypothetical protein
MINDALNKEVETPSSSIGKNLYNHFASARKSSFGSEVSSK